MADMQPSPDEILAQIQLEEQRARQGRLKIFLGASAGVGKTYAMLSESHQLLERGVDLVVGVAVTHGRKETQALLSQLPILPLKSVEYKGVMLKEFDLDAVLIRRPKVVVVDELAHSNAPGSRHPKRWQDVQELLDSGIDVYSAINIQHIESLNDVVAQISGVQVKETVPDALISRANEIELVDVTPDELRQRVKDGKVYVPEQVGHALEGFFKTSNLTALRELALRTAADQVDAQMEIFRKGEGGQGIWATRERVLVCIAPNHLGDRVLRTAVRIGNASKASLTAIYVESSRQNRRSASERELAERTLARAEELGIEVARRAGHDIVAEILRFAHSRNISSIIVGKPIKPRWREVCFGSVVDELIRCSGSIQIRVVSGEPGDTSEIPRLLHGDRFEPKELAIAAGFVALSSALSWLSYSHLPRETIAMIYLLGIAYCSAKTKLTGALACSLMSVAAFDFFFVPPRFQFAVSDAAYLPTFLVMFGVGLLISSLTGRLKSEFQRSSERERRSAALYEATMEMAKTRGRDSIATAATERISQDLEIDACVFLPDENGRLHVTTRSRSHFENDHRETPVAHWVFDNGRVGGSGTDTLPSAKGFYLPLKTTEATVGVLGAKSHVEGQKLDSNQIALLQTFANGLGLAIERALLAKQSAEARLDVESERLRNALLSSVSHDIRSPLTAIAGAASALRDSVGDPQRLAETIYLESERLNRHVRNLLDMTRIESGAVKPNLDWNSLEETVGGALARTSWQISDRKVNTFIDKELPLLQYDASLVENALVNLVENAVKHTPAGSTIEVSANRRRGEAVISVVDHGPGVRDLDKEKVFDKFHRESDEGEGFGLGLSISRAIARIHGGNLSVSDTAGGGATFSIELPIRGKAPEVPVG